MKRAATSPGPVGVMSLRQGTIMKTKSYLPLIATALLTFGAPSAQASTLIHFVITGSYNATFDLDADALPDYFSSTSFDFNNIDGSFAGVRDFGNPVPASGTTASKVQFYRGDFGGGIGISVDGVMRFVADGAQLYSGTTSAPEFVAGQYALAPLYSYGASSVTVSYLTSGAVPEPASWALMLGGFGLVGGALRRRQQLTVRFA
jgi:hypothetical protein